MICFFDQYKNREETLMPEISIIVPVYKVEQYLDRCVNSILAQTFEDFELILVDDGSPDRCPDMCDEWSKRDKRIRVIHKKNGGAGSARNFGLKEAIGKYIGFVDSDDWIDKNMFQSLYNLLKKYPDAQIAQCDFLITHKESFIVQPEEKIQIFEKKDMLDYFYRINGEKSNNGVWNKLIDKRILKDFQFQSIVNEDVDASYDLFMRTQNMVITNQIYYFYFVNNFGVTRTCFKERDLEYLDVWDRIIKRTLEDSPAYIEYAKIGRKRANFTLLSRMFINGYDRKNPEMKNIKSRLKKEVRRDFFTLLRWKMPISRKLLLFVVCII